MYLFSFKGGDWWLVGGLTKWGKQHVTPIIQLKSKHLREEEEDSSW